MSDKMEKGDSVPEEATTPSDEATSASVADPADSSSQNSSDPAPRDTHVSVTIDMEVNMEVENLTESVNQEAIGPPESSEEPQQESTVESSEAVKDEIKKGLKRRASIAFSDDGSEEFKGFNVGQDKSITLDYTKVLNQRETEVAAAIVDFTPLRSIMATPPVPRATKRARQDTDSSRPSSALSSRSEDAISTDAASTASSPANRHRHTEISSPLLRVPLEHGWKRELVYRAALDIHSRRNADIYYYSPLGKKLRSMREILEHLHGTGLSAENFSFFKEPLGLDDPEKEIIRDAKVMSRPRESPAQSPAPLVVEGKRTPKPKAPKGATPEPATPKSPPAKIKVKSMGSRLSSAPAAAPAPIASPATPTPTPVPKTKKAQTPAPAPAPIDNNNSATWKKPKQPTTQAASGGGSAQLATQGGNNAPRRLLQPCSVHCGGGVPSLACSACLCLYHPACVQYTGGTFLCRNCQTSDSTAENIPVPGRVPPVQNPPRPGKVAGTTSEQAPLTLTMKVGRSEGPNKVWSVKRPSVPVAPPASCLSLPQSIAVFNGNRFIVVPRAVNHEKRSSRLTNGGAPPGKQEPVPPARPARKPRQRPENIDHFTDFYNKAQAHNYDVAVQIFQYVGMRELARSARVCKLWRQLASSPALWRHVRMKNSHVSSWAELCAALKRNGTAKLDLRKMLLPQNDAKFWEQFAANIPSVDCLERIEMCRCPASAVEALCTGLPQLKSLSALAIKDSVFDPSPLENLTQLQELKVKSMAGLSLKRDLKPIANLTKLTHLSLTSIKELGWCACEAIGYLSLLETLELGECTFRAEFGAVLGRLRRLTRLRLERGTAQCAAAALLRAAATLPRLHSLELVNLDIKVGFDDALAECKNIQRLLIIPTYVSQSATTNKQVLSGVLRLKDTLTHLVWGVTIELLRVTELFIDQCGGGGAKREVGECIPVLKPVPGCKLPARASAHTPPQVEILPLPMLQRLLGAQLPNTKLKLLRIPFHATWRQSLQDFH